MNLFLLSVPLWFSYASGFASLIALLFVVLYFCKPHLRIKAERKSIYNNHRLLIKCTNKNVFRTTIKDIKCDVVISNTRDFDEVCTLSLEKNWTPGITYNDSYTFFNSKGCLCDFDSDPFIKVRVLSSNILGIKKMHQGIYACGNANNLHVIKRRRGIRPRKKKA